MKKDFLIIGAIAFAAVVVVRGYYWYENDYVNHGGGPPQRQTYQPGESKQVSNSNQDTLRYADYTPELFSQLKSQRRVLFFKANWCGTCAGADKDISEHTSDLPANISVLKVNYDQEADLRTKYGVTAQHTFVEVDSAGNLVKIWNGGGVAELLQELG